MWPSQGTYSRARWLAYRGSLLLLGIVALVPGTSADSRPGSVGAASADPGRVLTLRAAAGARSETEVVVAALRQCGSPLSDDEQDLIATTIVRTARRHGYDPLFVQAIVEVESTCRPTARSHAGAVGLIQVKPSTARAVASRVGMKWRGAHQLMSPVINLELGVQYLAELEERFADPYLAVAAYNLGPTRVAAMEPSRARRSRYVRKVLSRYEGLLQEHGATAS